MLKMGDFCNNNYKNLSASLISMRLYWRVPIERAVYIRYIQPDLVIQVGCKIGHFGVKMAKICDFL